MEPQQGLLIAKAAFEKAALGPVPRDPKEVLRYVTILLADLPPVEGAGYVHAPAGGENVATLTDGTPVRVARIIYPDGTTIKVMNDVPNGGPQWAIQDAKEPGLYVSFDLASGASTYIPPPDNGAGDVVAGVLAAFSHIDALLHSIEVKVDNLTQQVVDLHQRIQWNTDAINEAKVKLDRTYHGNIKYLGGFDLTPVEGKDGQ